MKFRKGTILIACKGGLKKWKKQKKEFGFACFL